MKKSDHPKHSRHVCPKCKATFFTAKAWANHMARPALCEAYQRGESYVTATRKG